MDFDFDTAKRGDVITEEVYDYYLGMAIPRSLKNTGDVVAGFQLSGEVKTRMDTRTEKLRPMYETFGVKPDGTYIYLGVNFAGETNSEPYAKLGPTQWPWE